MARSLLPFVVLAVGIFAWDLVVRLNAIPPYVLPGPRLVFATLWSDWALLVDSLLVTLITTLEGFASRSRAASGWRCCSTSRASSNTRCFPMR